MKADLFFPVLMVLLVTLAPGTARGQGESREDIVLPKDEDDEKSSKSSQPPKQYLADIHKEPARSRYVSTRLEEPRKESKQRSAENNLFELNLGPVLTAVSSPDGTGEGWELGASYTWFGSKHLGWGMHLNYMNTENGYSGDTAWSISTTTIGGHLRLRFEISPSASMWVQAGIGGGAGELQSPESVSSWGDKESIFTAYASAAIGASVHLGMVVLSLSAASQWFDGDTQFNCTSLKVSAGLPF